MDEMLAIKLRRIGRTIREGRLMLNLSQEDFAEMAGIHRTYVGHLENGRVNVSFENLSKVAKAQRMTVAELMTKAKV